jgi:hypothetical protein
MPQRISRKIKSKDQEATHHTPFFGHRGKDEIGVAFGQIIEMALCAIAKTFAEYAARTDGDFRLGNVIAGPERIVFGIEENQHAVLLIRLQAEKIDKRRETATAPPPRR